MNIPNTIDAKTNNFDFLRLFAALVVIFSHSMFITRASLIGWHYSSLVGGVGVNIFFILSGFLITKSWLANSNFFLFLKKRFLRIYPALVLTILSTVFIIGPMATFLSKGHYFSNKLTWKYLLDGLLLFKLVFASYNYLPGVFINNPTSNIVNASLWTIPIEIAFYILVAIAGITGTLKKRIFALSIFSILAIINIILLSNDKLKGLFVFPYFDILRLGAYFTAGMSLYLYRDKISINKKVLFTIILLFCGLFVESLYFEMLSYFLLPLILITMAFAKFNFAKKITQYGDFSYGLYLFAYPIQQLLTYFSQNTLGLLSHFLLTIALTFPLAMLSWHLLEKQVLKLKSVSLMPFISR